MPDPNPYTPSYDFSDFEADNPRNPKPGAEIDVQFADIATSTEQLVAAVKDVRRSDGALKNGIVTPDSLNDQVKALIGSVDYIDTVGEAIADVTTVATDLDGDNTIGTVAGSIGNVNVVGADIANVNIVAADLAGTDTVGTVATNIATVEQAGEFLTAAETDADRAEAAKDAAVAASEAAGVDHWEDTYADAEAALGGYTEGDVVGVFADETRGGATVWYRVESGGLVEKLATYRTISPEGFGGATDTARWQAAINYALSLGVSCEVRGQSREYTLTNLEVDAALLANADAQIVIDFNGADVTVDPTTSGSDGAPVLYAHGEVGEARAIDATSVGATSITATGFGSEFSDDDLVIVGDATHVDGWDEGLTASPASGYTGRSELNYVVSVAGDIITLRNPVSWALTQTPYIQKVAPLRNFSVRNIGRLVEENPGSAFGGGIEDFSAAPHIIAIDYADSPRVEAINADGFQLHVASFKHCAFPTASGIDARNPFRPSVGGHGYGVRFDRCLRGVAGNNHGVGVRHLVDDVQSISTLSHNNKSVNAAISSYCTHGMGSRGFNSVDDAAIGGPGLGWQIGNPSFAGDFDSVIERPVGRALNTGISFQSASANLRVVDPDLVDCSVREVLVSSGATGLEVVGGRIKPSRTSSGAITSRRQSAAGDTYGLDCGDISIRGVTFDLDNVPSGLTVVGLSASGDIEIVGNTANVDANVGSVFVAAFDNATVPQNVKIENNKGRGTGTGRFVWTRLAPSGRYSVRRNEDSGAARVVQLAVTNDMILTENDFGIDTYTFSSPIKPAIAAGAIVLDNRPSIGYAANRRLRGMVDTETVKKLAVSGDSGTNREIVFGTRTGSTADDYDTYSDRAILRLLDDPESGGNAGSDFEILLRADNGGALRTIINARRSDGRLQMNAGPVLVQGTWQNPFYMLNGSYALWVNATNGKLYKKNGVPASDTDGVAFLEE